MISTTHTQIHSFYIATQVGSKLSDDSTRMVSELLDITETAHFTGFTRGGSIKMVFSFLSNDLNSLLWFSTLGQAYHKTQ